LKIKIKKFKIQLQFCMLPKHNSWLMSTFCPKTQHQPQTLRDERPQVCVQQQLAGQGGAAAAETNAKP
jgi:hypothetical protein